MYIDTHCHLDSNDYARDIDDVIAHCIELGLERIVIPGADIGDLERAIELSEKHSQIYFAAGIHPNNITSLDNAAKNKLTHVLEHPKCVAVGEIGLDYHYLESSSAKEVKKLQADGFADQIKLAIAHSKPLIIHTRESNSDTLEILRAYENRLKAVIFHCFGGDTNLTLNCPCYYGIGGVVSFKNAQVLRDSLQCLSLDSILLETDAPYLAPVPYRGKRNTPEHIPLINEILSSVLGIDEEQLAAIITRNARYVFGF